MKILVVQESDWIEKGPHQSHHIFERLSERGHDVKVIDFEIEWRKKRGQEIYSERKVFENVYKVISGKGVTVIRPPIIKLPIADYFSLLFTHQKEIKTQLKNFEPDAIVGFGILNTYLSLRLAKKKNIPFVYYIIDELHRLLPQRYLQKVAKLVEQYNMRNADMVISINEGLREYTIQMGAHANKTKVIRAGIDLERFDNADGAKIRKKLGIKDDEVVLFFMGWLYEFSGLKEVAQRIVKTNYNIKLLIVGKGDLWDDLKRIAKENKIKDKIIMVGWRPYEEIPHYVKASDVCLLPAYKNEIMMNIVPIKMYEYMAAGKPVIATALPGIMKEFGENNGVIYIEKPGDAIEKAIELAKTNSIKDIGEKARKFVEKYDWNKIVNEFEKVMKEILR